MYSTHFPTFRLPITSPITRITGPTNSHSANQHPRRLSHGRDARSIFVKCISHVLSYGEEKFSGQFNGARDRREHGRVGASGTTMCPPRYFSNRARKWHTSKRPRSRHLYYPFNTSQPLPATSTSTSSPILWSPSTWCTNLPPVSTEPSPS